MYHSNAYNIALMGVSVCACVTSGVWCIPSTVDWYTPSKARELKITDCLGGTVFSCARNSHQCYVVRIRMIHIILCLRRVWIQLRLIVLNPQSINAIAHHQHYGAESSNQLITTMIAYDLCITIHPHLGRLFAARPTIVQPSWVKTLHQAVDMPVVFLRSRMR